MAVTKAVASTVRSPGFYLLVNLLAGISSPGAAPQRALVIAQLGSAGDMTAGTELREAIAGPDAASTGFGPGMPGHLAVKRLFQEYKLALVDIIAVAAPGGSTASGTFTFTLGTPPVTSARTVTAKVCGRVVVVTWAAGESITTIAARLAAAIVAISADLPCSATSSLGVVTVTAKGPGTWGNDITISVTVSGGAPADASCAASGANLTGGTANADPTTALTTVSGREYDLICCVCTGNADQGTASSTSAPGRVSTHITTYNTGSAAKLQQAVFGFTSTTAIAKTGAAQQNDVNLEFLLLRDALSIPAEVAGAEVGRRLRMESDDPSVNPEGTLYRATLYPPANLVTGALTPPELEDLLQSGVSGVVYDSSGNPKVSRPMTTHWKDTAGNPDDRCLDISIPTTTYRFAKRIRTTVPQEFQGSKLSPDLEPGSRDALPPNTVEVRDVRAFIETEMLDFVAKGWFDGRRMRDALANGELIVEVDPDDEHQCNMVIPTRVARGFFKQSAVVNAI